MSWTTILGLLFVTAGSTLIGSLPVLFHRYLRQSRWEWWESFCGGVMVSASIFSLFLPAFEILREKQASLMPLLQGALLGTMFILLAEKLVRKKIGDRAHHRAYLFVLAMGLHNVPEGLAVGVDTAALGWREALPLNAAIFLQNLPEGLVSSMTFLVAGFGVKRSLMANAVTAVIEGIFALIGFVFVLHMNIGLAFLLSFAGACMVTVVVNEGVYKLRTGGAAGIAWPGLIVGFAVCAMLDLFL